MPGLQRKITLTSAIAIVIGGVIGSGIFMKPSVMALQLGSPMMLLVVWIVAGLITLAGALSNAEVASMFPETGGQYVFFQKMYGNTFAFFYGWASLTVFNTAGNASIAYVFAQYAGHLIDLPRFAAATEQSFYFHIPFIGNLYPLDNFGVKSLTIFLILLLTALNSKSVNYGSAVQRFLTALKAAAIIFLISGIFFSGKGSFSHLFNNSPDMPEGWAMIRAFMAAMAGAFWAYDGWNNITFVAGEIKEPQKNIPKSLFTGLSFCIITYALINLAFIYILAIGDMAKSGYVASDAATISLGLWAGTAVTLMVVLSTLGATNANVLSTARVTFAMGKENRWMSFAGRPHEKNHTPVNALMLNAAWTIILIISGSFDMLTDMLIFISWFFYGMSALGLIILRKKLKDVNRPYRVWGYPLVPLVFVLFTLFFLCSTVYTEILNYINGSSPVINSLLGVLIVCTGIPFYFLAKKKSG